MSGRSRLFVISQLFALEGKNLYGKDEFLKFFFTPTSLPRSTEEHAPTQTLRSGEDRAVQGPSPGVRNMGPITIRRKNPGGLRHFCRCAVSSWSARS